MNDLTGDACVVMYFVQVTTFLIARPPLGLTTCRSALFFGTGHLHRAQESVRRQRRDVQVEEASSCCCSISCSSRCS